MGILRFYLALCVIAFHLTQKLPIIGALAVNFFYILSGYLMTLVLNEVYRFDLALFAANRILRLFPAYFAVATCALILHTVSPETRHFHVSWENPAQPLDILGNVLLFPWAFLSDPTISTPFDLLHSAVNRYRLVPSTWSVGVELVCYFVLWAVTARSHILALVTLGLALAWDSYFAISKTNMQMLYSPWPAAMVGFSLGSLAYHFRAYSRKLKPVRLTPWFSTAVAATSIVIFTSVWLADFPSGLNTISYIITFLIGAASVYVLQDSRATGLFAVIDRHLGELSYPMFLSQYVATAAFFQLLPVGTPTRGWLVFAYGTLATIIMAEAIVFFVDRPIGSVRNRLRHRSFSSTMIQLAAFPKRSI